MPPSSPTGPSHDASGGITHGAARGSRTVRTLLWLLTLVLALSAMVYQRRTGPTYPWRGTVETAAGEKAACKLIRSHETTADAPIEVPDPGADWTATLLYRRFGRGAGGEAFTTVAMERAGGLLRGDLPKQFAAGKLEYAVELRRGDEVRRLPGGAGETVVLRFKDPVPPGLLVPHVALMVFAILFGVRAALGALWAPASMRTYAWLALAAMSLGGMVLGPIVQKYAFGHYWTGFPFGGDWTDNKTLFMWLAWVVACAVLGRARPALARAVVVLAAAVMLAVYLVPHSLGGSELDYGRLAPGTDPKAAIETGR